MDELEEIKSGNHHKYRVIIKTSDKTGSGTDALIKLRFFGTKGKSKIFKLKESKTHRIPFRRGNTDVFDLSVYDIGKIIAISIGHSEVDIGKILAYLIKNNAMTWFKQNAEWWLLIIKF